MLDDGVETVAIVYSLPELAVLLGLFAQHDIPTAVVGAGHAAVNPQLMVALGGVTIRVPQELAGDARTLLAEIAERPAAMRPRLIDNVALNALMVVLACVLGVAPIPPTRAAATFLLGNVRRPDALPPG